MKPGIGLLVGLLSVATFMAAPASARVHHHHHHHHHNGGGITCGPGTVNVGGVCTPTGNPGPTGNSNVAITPGSATMTLDGLFDTNVVITGLPPFITVDTAITACDFDATIGLDSTTTDALGRLVGDIFNNVTDVCVPGTYPVTFTETTTPFQTFTGFFTLHF